jgi:TorA maturation chaperone TorD
MEVLRALGALAEDAGEERRRVADALGLGPLDAAEFTDLFSFALYPYASVYLGAEGMLGGEARDRIAGFWRALGATPPDEPDHLTTMLALYASLAEAAAAESVPGRKAALEHARAAFFWEHLASWLPVYLAKARRVARGAYAVWARMLSDALESEAARLPAPASLPLHLRAVPPFEERDGNGDEEVIPLLLAPARAGFVLVRRDLRGIADALGVGLRQGERRYALGALLACDRPRVLGRLAGLALEAAACHAALAPAWGETMRFWECRAAATAKALRALEAASI